MNKTNQYFTRGLWIFALLIVCMFVLLYAIQVLNMPVLFICIIFCFILALGLMWLLMQANKTIEKNQQKILQLEHRVNILFQKEQQTTDVQEQLVEVFKADEILAKIIPDVEIKFDTVAAYTEKILQNIAKELDIVQGLIFVLSDTDCMFHISGQYAYYSEEPPRSFPIGETLSGQVAKNQKIINISDLPNGYISILSGLGKSAPRHLIISPVVHGNESIGVMELASFKPFGENEATLVQKISEAMANLLNDLRC